MRTPVSQLALGTRSVAASGSFYSAALLMVGGLLLAASCGCSSDSAEVVSGKSVDMSGVKQRADLQPLAPKNGLDLKLASDLFAAGLVIHPQRIFEHEALGPDLCRELLGEWATETEFPWEECQQVLLVFPAPTGGPTQTLPVAQCDFENPIEMESLASESFLESFQPSSTESNLWIDEANKIAIYQAAETRLIAGDREFVRAYAEDRLPRAGKLARLLGQLDLEADITGAANGTAFSALAQNAGGGQAGAGSFPERIEFAIDLNSETLGRLSFDVANEREANELEKQFEVSRGTLKAFAKPMAQAMASNGNSATRSLFVKVAGETIDGLRFVKLGDQQVELLMKRPKGFEPALTAFMELMAEERQWNQRQERLEEVAQAAKKALEQEKLPTGQAAEETGLSWRVHLLPSLGEQELFDQFHLDEPWDSEHNLSLLDQMPIAFQTGESPTETSIIVVAGEQTAWQQTPPSLEPADGAELTIMLVEAGDEKLRPWTQPDTERFDSDDDWDELALPRRPFLMVAFLDGHVRRIPRATGARIVRALFTPEGGEALSLDAIFGNGGSFGGFPGGAGFGF